MSEELKKKLYQFDLTPPETVWAKISMALDEEHSGLAKKLYNIEIAPPAPVWNSISKELETQDQENLSSRLYRFETDPPGTSWQMISRSLSERRPLFIRSKVVPFAKYAAAACVVGIMILVGFKFFNQKSGKHFVAGRIEVAKKISPTTTPGVQKTEPQPEYSSASNNLPTEASRQATSNPRKRTLLQQAGYMTEVAGSVPADNSSSLACDFEEAPLRGEVPGNCSLISETDRYSTFISPEGYLVRISKKLDESLGCNYNNRKAEEQDPCESQIQKWGEKIAQSLSVPAPDNFMNIVNIIRSTQGNE